MTMEEYQYKNKEKPEKRIALYVLDKVSRKRYDKFCIQLHCNNNNNDI